MASTRQTGSTRPLAGVKVRPRGKQYFSITPRTLLVVRLNLDRRTLSGFVTRLHTDSSSPCCMLILSVQAVFLVAAAGVALCWLLQLPATKASGKGYLSSSLRFRCPSVFKVSSLRARRRVRGESSMVDHGWTGLGEGWQGPLSVSTRIPGRTSPPTLLS